MVVRDLEGESEEMYLKKKKRERRERKDVDKVYRCADMWIIREFEMWASQRGGAASHGHNDCLRFLF